MYWRILVTGLVLAFASPVAFATFINVASVGECYSISTDSLATCEYSGPGVYLFLQVDGFSRAYGDATGLHTQTETVVTSPFAFAGGVNVSVADSALQDYLQFQGDHPATAVVSMSVTTHGSASGSGYGFTQLVLTDGVSGGDECFFSDVGVCTASALINLNVPLGFRLSLLTGTTVESVDVGKNTGEANFWNTAYISSLAFFDIDGVPLALSYTTDSGLTYPMSHGSTVSEPASLALLGLAFAGLGCARRRR